MALRTRNAALVIAEETTLGTWVDPNESTQMVRVAGLKVTPAPNVLEDPTLTSGLDAGERVVGSVPVSFTASCLLRGATTAGGLPDWNVLAKIAGWVPTVHAAIPAGGSTWTTCSSGTTSTAVFAVAADGWPSTNDALLGAVLEVDVDGVGAGASEFLPVVGYTVSGGNATVTFGKTASGAISASSRLRLTPQVRYVPISTFPGASAQLYRDGRRWEFEGGRAELRGTLTAGQRGNLDFNVSARLHSDLADATMPSDSTNANPRPQPWKGGWCLLNRTRVAVQSVTWATGNQLVSPDDPNETEGLGPTEITGRDVTGTINPLATSVATRNTFAEMRAGTAANFVAMIPGAAGNRVAFVVPRMILLNVDEADRQGLVADEIPFQASGADKSAFLTLY